MHTQPYIHPQGPIPAVEPYHSYSAFLHAVEPEYALLKYTDMRKLVKRGGDCRLVLPRRDRRDHHDNHPGHPVESRLLEP